MIIFGDYNTLTVLIQEYELDPRRLITFNLTGMKEDSGIPNLGILPPPQLMFSNNVDERINDKNLYDYIFSNDEIFLEFASKIIYPIYSGIDVYIVVTIDDGVFNMITESIIKVVQQRYGFICQYFKRPDDFYRREDQFTIFGIYNFDKDKERYQTLAINKWGVPKPSDGYDADNDNLLRY